jgi:hypothetical protein
MARDRRNQRPLRPRQTTPFDTLIETLSQMAGNHQHLQGGGPLLVYALFYDLPHKLVRPTQCPIRSLTVAGTVPPKASGRADRVNNVRLGDRILHIGLQDDAPPPLGEELLDIRKSRY